MRNYNLFYVDKTPLEVGKKYLVCFYPQEQIHEVQVLRISDEGYIKLDYDISQWYYRDEFKVLEKLK